MKNIIYVAVSYPYPAINGGEQGILQHVKELEQTNYKDSIKFIFSNGLNKDNITNDKKNFFLINYSKLERNNIYRLLRRICLLFTSIYPCYMILRMNKATKSLITNANADIYILDGFQMLSTLPKKKNYKLIYIAHDIQINYELEVARLEKNIFTKIYRYVDSFKTMFLEKQLLKKADKIVYVSTSDYKTMKEQYPQKTVFSPHKILSCSEKWNINNIEDKTLFFCGPLNFAPNYDAIDWLVNILKPELPSDIKIKIAGKNTDAVPNSWRKNNIEYLGFVSEKELQKLFLTSTAFICPIIRGSGVKVKVTEALGYRIPIIATKESLEGLDYIDIEPLIDRENLTKTKECIIKLLNNKQALEEYSTTLSTKAQEAEKNYANFYQNILDEVVKTIN